MTGKTPGSGRKAGTPNKKKRILKERIDESGFEPIEAMQRIGKAAEGEGDMSLAFLCAKELAQYSHSKLRALAVTGVESRPISFDINIGNGLPLSDSLKLIENAAKDAALESSVVQVAPERSQLPSRLGTPNGHNGLSRPPAQPPEHLITPSKEPAPALEVKPVTPVTAPGSDWDMTIENWNSRPDPSLV